MRNGATWQLELGRTVRAELQLKLDFLILPPGMSSNLGPVCGESGCSGKTDTQPVARVVGTYLHCVGHRDMVLPASGLLEGRLAPAWVCSPQVSGVKYLGFREVSPPPTAE